MGITGIGIDLVEVKRIEEAVERFGDRFLQKIYTRQEIDSCMKRPNKYLSFAARFAAKEAFLKAVGTGITQKTRWKEVEVVDDEHSPPFLQATGYPETLIKNKKTHLSLSHTHSYAIAVVIVEE